MYIGISASAQSHFRELMKGLLKFFSWQKIACLLPRRRLLTASFDLWSGLKTFEIERRSLWKARSKNVESQNAESQSVERQVKMSNVESQIVKKPLKILNSSGPSWQSPQAPTVVRCWYGGQTNGFEVYNLNFDILTFDILDSDKITRHTDSCGFYFDGICLPSFFSGLASFISLMYLGLGPMLWPLILAIFATFWRKNRRLY
jgi:hypothetical protein